jgi:hypothetical protein
VLLKFTDKNFKQPNCFWLSMHAYRILLPSKTDFNSREQHMLTDSVQAYNKPIIDLACSVTSVLWNIRPLFFAWTSLLRRSVHTKKTRSDISQYRSHARSISRYYYYRLLYMTSCTIMILSIRYNTTCIYSVIIKLIKVNRWGRFFVDCTDLQINTIQNWHYADEWS